MAIDWATIPFPSPLNREKLEALFLHVARELPGEVVYLIKEHRRVGEFGNGVVGSELSSINANCTITSRSVFNSACFSCLSHDKDPVYVGGLRFSVIPGYERDEHRKEQVQLVDRVRELVNQYFIKK